MDGTSSLGCYRRWGTASKFLGGLLAAGALGGCASLDMAPPMGYRGQPFTPAADEQILWRQAGEEEATLGRLGRTRDDPPLEDYLSTVALRLLPPEVRAAGAPPVRVIVLRDRLPGAFTLPHGRIYLHTGLVARLENEAQLAAVLGRELTHITHRHALRLVRAAGPGEISSGPAGSARPGAATPLTPHALRGLPLAYLAAVTGHGRALEREADAEGMARLIAAGYDPREGPRAFALLREAAADGHREETFFLDTAPILDQRIAGARCLLRARLAGTDPARLARGTEEFARHTRMVVRDNALLDIHAGRFDLARTGLDRVLARTPDDPLAHVYYGDLHRLQAQRTRALAERGTLLERARVAYERAAAIDPALPHPFRQLGLLYYQQQDAARAQQAFRRYLTLAPDAPDAPRIREYLVELGR